MRDISTLHHHVVPLPDGGMVLLLDTGAVIGPEAEAMLQALYSRDPASVHTHLTTIATKGPEKFMASYYVGYGHKSIGDCGTVTIFIEGISMLAAKAIQDWMLYAGQEVSTRYVDFSRQPFIDPVRSSTTQKLLTDLRSFYLAALPVVEESLMHRYPRSGEENDSVYRKAIKARSFDILRSFLPAGASTSVAWHTNLRQGADKIALLRHHPLPEVRTIADGVEKVLQSAYPSSFGHKRYEDTEDYNSTWMRDAYYLVDKKCPEFVVFRDDIDRAALRQDEWRNILAHRPPKTELPKMIGELGTLQFRFLLDFGSFRDLQRQRAVFQRMPLLSFQHGFEKWYLSELPQDVRRDAKSVLAKNKERIATLGKSHTSEVLQYYIPMGYRVPCRLTGDLSALVYLAELRSGPMVHPTLQLRAKWIADSLVERFSQFGLVLHGIGETGRFDVRRGEQDIVKKVA